MTDRTRRPRAAHVCAPSSRALAAATFALAGLGLGACSLGLDPSMGIAPASAPRAAAVAPAAIEPIAPIAPLAMPAPAPGAVERAALDAAPKGDRLSREAAEHAAHYGARTVDGIALPAVDHTRLSPEHLRREVAYSGAEAPGSIVIDVTARHLYLVQPGGRAIRYGIAVGREGFGWTGTERLTRRAEWPTWTPPASMIEREPELAEWAEGMPGSADNPLGARALYLGDTLYRIHGSNQPYSIGKAASSGCFRMVNQDVLDLYERVKPGAMVYVRDSLPTVVASR